MKTPENEMFGTGSPCARSKPLGSEVILRDRGTTRRSRTTSRSHKPAKPPNCRTCSSQQPFHCLSVLGGLTPPPTHFSSVSHCRPHHCISHIYTSPKRHIISLKHTAETAVWLASSLSRDPSFPHLRKHHHLEDSHCFFLW